jgi:hypothetical protein
MMAYLSKRSNGCRRGGVRLRVLVEALAVAVTGDEHNSENAGGHGWDWLGRKFG